MVRPAAFAAFAALVLAAFAPRPAAAEVPKFEAKFFDRVEASRYSAFADKALLKVIPEKRVAIYGNPDGVLIVSEPPMPPAKMRYHVEATREGKVTLHYYLDPDKRTERPEPFRDRKREVSYDKQVVTVELPFKLKHREKTVVWVNDRLETWIPFSGQNDLKRSFKRGKFLR